MIIVTHATDNATNCANRRIYRKSINRHIGYIYLGIDQVSKEATTISRAIQFDVIQRHACYTGVFFSTSLIPTRQSTYIFSP